MFILYLLFMPIILAFKLTFLMINIILGIIKMIGIIDIFK